VPFKTSDGGLKSNTADWLNLIRTGIPYVYGDMGNKTTRDTITRMVDLLNLLLDATADYDPDDEEANEASQIKCRNLRLQAIEGLSYLERDFPETELSPFVHEILHVSEFVFMWNNVRNYWCFIVERFVGWMKGFIKNRSLCLPNMVQRTQPVPYTTIIPLHETGFYTQTGFYSLDILSYEMINRFLCLINRFVNSKTGLRFT
jgi:hypothetical protein